MSDLTLLFSSVAIILSVASVVFVIIKIGLGLGLEFVEKPEIRAMKEKIENKLNDEWVAILRSFLKGYSEKIEDLDQEKVSWEIVSLGEKTRHVQIASTLLKIISKIGFDIIKFAVTIIAILIIMVATVWAVVSFPDLSYNLWLLLLLEVITLAIFSFATRNAIRHYMAIRSLFYLLSEKPSLVYAGNIMKELEDKDLIYA